MSDITGTNTLLVPVISPLSRFLTKITAILGGLSLFINVLVVFSSVIFRYAFHSPLEWAEEVARALMIALVFFGVATSSGRGGHIGIDLFLGLLPSSLRAYVVHSTRWILVFVSIGLVISSYDLVYISLEQTTETGMPLALFYIPVFIGAIVMFVATLEHVFQQEKKIVLRSGIGVLGLIVIGLSLIHI